MKEKEAIEIASNYAKQQGYDISQYDITAKHEKGEWVVHFKGKKPVPGNFFTVYIDDKSKVVKQLFRGK
jgi:hypothetical protein